LVEHIWGNKKDDVFYTQASSLDESTDENTYILMYKDNYLQILNNKTEGEAEVFDALGKLILKEKIILGDNYISVPTNQFLIVRVHGNSTKLYTK
jgi:hypothetical protein